MEIRLADDDDIGQIGALLGIAYLDDGTEAMAARFRVLNELNRTFVAVHGDELVGSVSAYSLDLTVPGRRTVAMAGTTIVAVKPTHRRRGLLRRLMVEHLADAARRGEPLAGLWASEAAIYGRFGYGWATDFVSAEIDTVGIQISGELDQSVDLRLVDRSAFLATAPAIYDQKRLGEPGTIGRSTDWWERRRTADDPDARRGASGLRYLLARRAGQPVGYAVYRTKDVFTDGVSTGEIRLSELIALDVDAELATWNMLFSIDLTTTIVAMSRPTDDPLLHRLEDPRKYLKKVGDALYVRVNDVVTALESRDFSDEGSLTLGVTDHDIAGTYRLDVGKDGKAQCTEVDDQPDLTMDARTLGAVYLGGRRFRTLQRAGRVTGSDRAVTLGDRMFQAAVTPPLARDVF